MCCLGCTNVYCGRQELWIFLVHAFIHPPVGSGDDDVEWRRETQELLFKIGHHLVGNVEGWVAVNEILRQKYGITKGEE